MAGNKATQLVLSLKLGGGKYKNSDVESATGVGIKTHFNPDKNSAQIAREVQAKVLRDVIAQNKVGKDFHFERETGTVFVDRRPVAQVHITSETTSIISWMHQRRIAVGLDAAKVGEEFKAAMEGKGGQWS